MRSKHFKAGQAIFWIARVTKTGEARYRIPGYIVNMTPKRVAILIQQRNGRGALRHVTAKRLTASHLAPLPLSTLCQTMADSQLHKVSRRRTAKVPS